MTNPIEPVEHNHIFQSEHHPLVNEEPQNVEELALSLIHHKAYVDTAKMVVGSRVLDIGCNTGYGSRILAEQAEKVIGIDVSSSALDYAWKHHQAINLEFLLADGTHLDFPDHSFDVVTSFQVIEHVQEADRYLSEIRRVLKPGGLAVFTTPNALLRLEPGMKPWNIFHVREFSPDEFCEQLTPYFEQVEVKGLFAVESLYDSQIARIARAKRVARNRLLFSAKRFLQTYTSSSIQHSAERLATAAIPTRKNEQTISLEEARQEWSLDSLEYKKDEIDLGLDLMAICHD